jgi:hypothetical protein
MRLVALLEIERWKGEVASGGSENTGWSRVP